MEQSPLGYLTGHSAKESCQGNRQRSSPDRMNSRLLLSVLQLLFIDTVLGDETTTATTLAEAPTTTTTTWLPSTSTVGTFETSGELPAEAEVTEQQDPHYETTDADSHLTSIVQEPSDVHTTSTADNSKSKAARHAIDTTSPFGMLTSQFSTQDYFKDDTTMTLLDFFGSTKYGDHYFKKHHHHNSGSSRFSFHDPSHSSHDHQKNDFKTDADVTTQGVATDAGSSSWRSSTSILKPQTTRSPNSRSSSQQNKDAGFSAASTTNATNLQSREHKFKNQEHHNSNSEKKGSTSNKEQEEKDFFENPFSKKNSSSRCQLPSAGVIIAAVMALRIVLL